MLALASSSATGGPSTELRAPSVTTYKTPTCGCCAKWVDHLQAHGFDVTTIDLAPGQLGQLKVKHRIPPALRTCHTALVGNYVIEGHVPADVVKRLLAERPAVAGIGVAGMPIGSPGMEGSHREAYDVLAFKADGSTMVFAKK